jgi:CO/xanthine dehydrogenase Mo-binding subunit
VTCRTSINIRSQLLRRAAKGPIEIVRDGNFLAILCGDETVVEAVAAVAPNHVVWDGVDAIQPFQEEARWLLQQPSIDRTVGPLPHPILQRRAAANRRPIPGCISPTHRVAEVEVGESVRLLRVWCPANAGLVINPDGAINQLEGGIIQAASWALKEGVRLDTGGISSRDRESYPVRRFSEVPEVLVELVNPSADLPPLGGGEASGGPAVAAIGNAVAHALGARLRDLPLTRDRVMAALLKA